MRNIALILEYLGTAYHGWQVQKSDITVGETLERATQMVVGHPVHIVGCGRTDAGVHAKSYVANFHTDSGIPADRLPYALNTHLPQDIVVRAAMDMHDGFNAIGSCVRKEYTYLIYNSAIRDPFYVNRAWFYPKHLDESVMQRAAQQFVGEHDFAAVRSVGTEVKSTVRTVYYYDVEREGDILRLRVCANGFLYNMLKELKTSLDARAIEFSWDDSLIDYLVKKSYSVAYGARNLRRTIQKDVEDPIAERIIDSFVTPLHRVAAAAKDDKVVLTTDQAQIEN